jgi:hypothetical protein
MSVHLVTSSPHAEPGNKRGTPFDRKNSLERRLQEEGGSGSKVIRRGSRIPQQVAPTPGLVIPPPGWGLATATEVTRSPMRTVSATGVIPVSTTALAYKCTADQSLRRQWLL